MTLHTLREPDEIETGNGLADLVPEDVIEAVAGHLSLGLDCNVNLMACREAVAELFSALERDSWVLSPPAQDTRVPSA